MNYPGRVIAGFIMIVLISVFPLQYLAQSNSDTIDALVEEKIQAFSDSIRKNGRLDISMYEDFIHYLDATGELYDVEIEDIHPVTGEEFSCSDTDGNTVACEDNSHNHNTDKHLYLSGKKAENPVSVSMKYTLPEDDSKENHDYDNNEDIQVKSFAAHTHNDDCYDGTLHVCDDINCDYGLIAVASAQGGLYYSKNGLNWTKSITCVARDVAYGNGKFVAVGDNATWTSSDGITWTQNNITKRFTKVKYGAGAFVAIASEPGGGNSVYISKDGVSWTLISGTALIVSYNSFAYTGGYFYLGYNSGYGRVTVYNNGDSYSGYSHDYVETTYTQAADYVICRNSAMSSGMMDFYKGGSSVTWNNERSGTNYLYYCYIKGNGEYIFFANSNRAYGGTYKSSTLPSFGTKISNFALYNHEYGIYFGNMYLIAGNNYTSKAIPTIAVSVDGVNWTTSLLPERFTGLVCNIEGGTGVVSGPCIKAGKYYNASGTEVQLICDQVVTSITATNPEQTVMEGEEIISTAIATYLDGHRGIVNCTSNFDPNLLGNQTVTLTYSGLVGNARTVGTRTCTLSVTLIGNSPLSYISVEPSVQTIERYMLPSFSVTAFYEDGSNKTIYSYKVSGFDATVIGTQNLTISYSEGEITKIADVLVNVTPLQKVCSKCGTVYPLDQNDIDRGCPSCTQEIIRIGVDPGFVRVEQGAPLNIIVNAIYKDGHIGAVNGWTSNYTPDTLGMQIVTVEYGGYAAELMVWVDERSVICPICGTQYPVSDGRCPVCSENVVGIEVDPGTITVSQNDVITLTVIANYADGSSGLVTDWSIDRTSTEPGTYLTTVSYLGASTTITLIVIPLSAVQCPICSLIYEPTDHPRGCPVCSDTITGIEAYLTSGANLVQYGATPSITVVIVFRDEHRELATEGYTIENYNPYQLGTQTIIIYYNEFYVDIEIVVVDVLSGVTCPSGHVYYLNEDGSDPGCPYCNMIRSRGTVYYFDIVYINEIVNVVYTEGVYVFDQENYITVTVMKRNVSLYYNIQNTFFRTSMLGMKKKFVHGGGVY